VRFAQWIDLRKKLDSRLRLHARPAGGAVIGAPTGEELSACHGGNVYFSVDPYSRPGSSRPLILQP
jgi:hypothetical protein